MVITSNNSNNNNDSSRNNITNYFYITIIENNSSVFLCILYFIQLFKGLIYKLNLQKFKIAFITIALHKSNICFII